MHFYLSKNLSIIYSELKDSIKNLGDCLAILIMKICSFFFQILHRNESTTITIIVRCHCLWLYNMRSNVSSIWVRFKTIILTGNLDTIAQMKVNQQKPRERTNCREIDALVVKALNTDFSAIQYSAKHIKRTCCASHEHNVIKKIQEKDVS